MESELYKKVLQLVESRGYSIEDFTKEEIKELEEQVLIEERGGFVLEGVFARKDENPYSTGQ